MSTKQQPGSVQRAGGEVEQAAIGLRIKSGYATLVLVTGADTSPRVVDRRTIELSDSAVPDTRQPYHAGFGTEQKNMRIVNRLTRLIEECARRSVEAALGEYRRLGCELRGAGIVVGSDVDPQTITNPHIRAHASEGRLFRRVTEDAVRGFGVSCSIWIEKTLYAAAAERLGWTESYLKQTVTAAGRNVAGGWRGDDKVATVAAWLALRG